MRSFYPLMLAMPRTIVMEPKRCIDCKFYTSEFWSEKKYGKCSLFPKEETSPYYLVNGEKNDPAGYHYCATARSSSIMCGEEGRCFQYK